MTNSKIKQAIAQVSRRLNFKLYDQEADYVPEPLDPRFCTKSFRSIMLSERAAAFRTATRHSRHLLCVQGLPLSRQGSDLPRQLVKANSFPKPKKQRNLLLHKRSERTGRRVDSQVIEGIARHLDALQRSNKGLLKRCSSDLLDVKQMLSALKSNCRACV